MKFNKILRHYSTKYEKHIPEVVWFNYKAIKRKIKYVRDTYPEMCKDQYSSH